MFVDESLNQHLDTASSVKTQSSIIAEWNMNVADNIKQIGNYRFRPLDGPASKYGQATGSFDEEDTGNFYTGATDADISLDLGVESFLDNDNPVPAAFVGKKEKEKMLFSLEDCFGRFRPRSGINKVRYGITNYLSVSSKDMSFRPRYYMADKNDKFKYWSSYRTDSGVERGIASIVSNGQNYIEDAAPFVVYNSPVPANRIVTKMQTNVGTRTLSSFGSSGGMLDPFFGDNNKTTPERWKIQVLDENSSWNDAIVFDQSSTRLDGSAIVKEDGYLEIAYGLIVPEEFKETFVFVGEVSSETVLPSRNLVNGTAYLIKENANDTGEFYVWQDFGYAIFKAEYGWYLAEESVSETSSFVTDLVEPKKYFNQLSGKDEYEEFQYVYGVRLVVETMNKFSSTFDLIELSPRLAVDLSDHVTSFSIKKSASDLGIQGLPVGQLLASSGTMEIFDTKNAFDPGNPNSIVKDYINTNIQIKIYDVICEVPKLVDGEDTGEKTNYYVPVKTMYIDGFPSYRNAERKVSVELRDLFFYFESMKAPEILIQNASLSYAIALLLDSIGFSNYDFVRLDEESDPTIPYFYTSTEKSVAEVLQDLALSTQTAMFFDEYNNFIMMSKGYVLPLVGQRESNIVLVGSSKQTDDGVLENRSTASNKIEDILELSSQTMSVFNSGTIDFKTRYIQKSEASIKQAYLTSRDKRWIYKPALLWEVSGTENIRSVNEQNSTSSSYALTAIPLNSNLTSEVPRVSGGIVINNVIDLGESIYWLGKYNGYLYANGEVIKFDAMEYAISGQQSPVWISSIEEYQSYFSQIPFSGKMYPTGRVRIYSQPNYEESEGVSYLAEGAVAKHGRGQFGTKITSHYAGIDPYWKSRESVRGIYMDTAKMLSRNSLSGDVVLSGDYVARRGASLVPTSGYFPAGNYLPNNEIASERANKSLRTDSIKNFLSSSYSSEIAEASPVVESDMVQASALILEGPPFSTEESPINFVSYVYKDLRSASDNAYNANSIYRHFGTRMRVVGKVEATESAWQTASGSMTFYDLQSDIPDTPNTISGGSGGLGIMINQDTNVGYYFEIAALNAENISDYATDTDVANVFFYKVYPQLNEDGTTSIAYPSLLWSGIANITVDSGTFVGQERVFAQEIQTVYDLAVEYSNVGSSRNFYLYLNGTQIATVTDSNPLPEFGSMAMFVRGSSRCMFENVYALGANYSENQSALLDPIISDVFGKNEQITLNESFTKYAISGIVQSTYLSNVSPSEPPKYNIYYDEFGSIMREAAYFNIKYDKAFPALYSKVSPTFSKLRGYTVSSYFGGAYGAEFLIFNNTSSVVSLDEKTGNYLRIQGITFTQDSQHQLTVDDFFNRKADLSDPPIGTSSTIASPLKFKELYQNILSSRMTYGTKEFTLAAEYIQDYDSAYSMMDWILSKISKPRRSLGVRVFSNPTVQLGDIVSIDYISEDANSQIDPSSQFVVYYIEYDRATDGPSMTLYLSEVV